MERRRYIPILKGREGEYSALETLVPGIRDGLTPLLEIPPISWDYTEEQPAKTIDAHLSKVSLNIERAWGSGQTLFVDFLWIPDEERMADGTHPAEHVFKSARSKGLCLVPVIGVLRGEHYLEACRSAAKTDNLGVCVRIQQEDFSEFPDLERELVGLLSKVSGSFANADLLLDLRALGRDQNDDHLNKVADLIAALPRLKDWRSFAMAATSFPENLIGLPPSDISFIPRHEWRLWRNLWQYRRKLPRAPNLADYAISHPEPSEVDPRVMRPSASIRYTVEEAWAVLKGRNLKDYGYEQFHEVCQDLIKQPHYSGSRFSWGDKYIFDCAQRRAGTGNLTTWRKVGTSHHLAFVIHQLANEAVGS